MLNITGLVIQITPGLIAGILLILLLGFISALLSGAEIALFYIASSIRSRSEFLLSKKHLLLLKRLENPILLKTSIKVTGLFLKFLLILLVTRYTVVSVLNEECHWLLFLAFYLGFLSVYIFFIEILPKTYAEAIPEKYSLFSIYFIEIIFWFFTPVISLYNGSYGYFLKKAQTRRVDLEVPENNNSSTNQADYTDEEDMAKGIAKFGNIDVSQILRPKVDVVSLDYQASLQEILKIILESGYSRIPVYEDDMDNMKGVLYVKDLLPYIYSNDNFIWQTFVRPPYFVPESKKVIELLNEFKAQKIHMAIIVDEYGCTLGIVTLEDVLEEIVGEISDESDDEENFYSKLNENTYIFDAKILLNDFYKVVQIEPGFFDPVRGDADTLAGLILELKGEIPVPSEEISYKQFVFTIEAVDSRRIKQIKVFVDNSLSVFDMSL